MNRKIKIRFFFLQLWMLLMLLIKAGIPAAAEEGMNLESPCVCLMEVSTGKILYEKNANDRIHPASVTKIMTVLLAFEALDKKQISLSDEVVTSEHARSMGGSQVFLEEGERQNVDTLLKCILIASGNDAAVAMAEHIAGNEELFVKQMNEKAAQLGMKDTHFVDCCGLTDSSDHYTSARDVSIMSRELLYLYPQVTEYTSIWMQEITHVTANGSSSFMLSNTNKLLRAFSGCDGLKTGSTSLAKYCLSATAFKNNIRLIGVIMGAPSSKIRFSEAAEILQYGFSRCRVFTENMNRKLPQQAVERSLGQKISAGFQTQFSYATMDEEDFSKIERKIRWNESIQAPIKRGDILGNCVYYLNGKMIGKVNLISKKAIAEVGFWDYLSAYIEKWTL